MKVYKQLANTLTDALIYNSIIEENKRFNISEKKVLKQKCLIGAIICTAVYFVFFAFMLYPYCATISICTSIITISLALGVLIQEG